MRALQIFLMMALSVSSAALAVTSLPSIPHGIWRSDEVLPDDGGYGKYYGAWLFVGNDSIDEIFTLGAHYSKTKYVIVNKKSANALDVFEYSDPSETFEMSFSFNNSLLEVCRKGACISYSSAPKPPVFAVPSLKTPLIQVTTKWCVDGECWQQSYSPLENEQFFNLATELRARGGVFEAPPALLERHPDLHLSLASVAFRLHNNVSDLNAFSTQLYLMGGPTPATELILEQSSVLTLHEGILSTLTGNLGKKAIEVSVSIHQGN